MTNEGAQLLEDAKDDERTVEETLTDLHRRNSRLNWDIFLMLPELFNQIQNRQNIQADD